MLLQPDVATPLAHDDPTVPAQSLNYPS
jgi:hypothetical protein